ncbi:MAG: hypothetical protein HYR85_13300 [Planctomycetes bacterium]|nr:hypothetical protein [Planctomycetota bacterium]MBI3844945.1 hypothetical protein [Planctomycetota bacterium]
MLAAVLAMAGPSVESSAAEDPRATLLVHFADSTTATIEIPNSTQWLDAANVTRLEWRSRESKPIAAVAAAIGNIERWPFVVDDDRREATLIVTDEIRATWNREVVLRIESDVAGSLLLRARPHRLTIGPKGATLSMKDHASAFLPGSHDWAMVSIEAISGAWVRLAVRSVEGELLAPVTALYEGAYEAVVWLGDEEYAIRVERLRHKLIGKSVAELRVTRRWSPPQTRQLEAAKDVARGSAAPFWFQSIESVERHASAAADQLSRAQALLGVGHADDARAALEVARRDQEDATQERPRWLQPPSLSIAPEGAEFSVDRLDGVPVPGSRGSIEVVVSDIGRTEARLGVRTITGKTLAPPRAVGRGDEVNFRVGEQNYAIRVERLIRPFFRGHVHADLRVIRRGEREVRGGEPEPQPSLCNKLFELIEQESTRARQSTSRAEALLADGKTDEARAAALAARRSELEVQQAIFWFRTLTGEALMRKQVSVIEDLSLVKVHVVRTRSEFEIDLSNSPDAREREAAPLIPLLQFAGQIVGRHVFDMDLFTQAVDARILEGPVVGSRYAFGTDMGRKSPFEKRRDLEPGQTVEIHLWADRFEFPEVRGLEEGQDYWLVVTPPIALKSLPRKAGEMGRTWITFVMRATEP